MTNKSEQTNLGLVWSIGFGVGLVFGGIFSWSMYISSGLNWGMSLVIGTGLVLGLGLSLGLGVGVGVGLGASTNKGSGLDAGFGVGLIMGAGVGASRISGLDAGLSVGTILGVSVVLGASAGSFSNWVFSQKPKQMPEPATDSSLMSNFAMRIYAWLGVSEGQFSEWAEIDEEILAEEGIQSLKKQHRKRFWIEIGPLLQRKMERTVAGILNLPGKV